MRVIPAVPVLAFLCAPVLGHHSPNVHFDPDDVVEISGTLVAVGWQKPHVQLTVLVRDEDGNETTWQVEELSINEQTRRGVSRSQYRVGEEIRVAGARGRRNRNALFALNTLLADGRELVGPGEEPRWSDSLVMSREEYRAERLREARGANGLFRVWSRDIDAGGRALWNDSYPLTDEARRTQEDWDRISDNPYIQCQNGLPAIMDSNEPLEFVHDGDDILIRLEEQDVLRRVHMGSSPPNDEPSPYGISVGQWDGETLVVTTTEIDFPWFDQAGVPQSEELILEERFTVDQDQRYLNYTVTATDRQVFTEPVVLDKRWLFLGEEIQPYECNYERDDL